MQILSKKMLLVRHENKIVRHENIFMACFSYFCPPKRTQTDRKRIKNLAVRVFFFTFVGRIATKLLFKILFGIT